MGLRTGRDASWVGSYTNLRSHPDGVPYVDCNAVPDGDCKPNANLNAYS